MNIYDFMFIVGFITMILLILYKIYNVMNIGETFDLKKSFLFYAAFLIAYFVCMAIFFIAAERTIYMVLFRFSTAFVVMNTILMAIEVFLYIGKTARARIAQPYMAKEFKY